jgi:hypothetical protein
VLGEEVDVAGLKRAIEAPRPVEIPLSEAGGEPAADAGAGDAGAADDGAGDDGAGAEDEGR